MLNNMLIFCIIVYFVPFVFVVDGQTNRNNNYEIATKLILSNGTIFKCPNASMIYLNENDTVTVEMTHSRYINYALVTISTEGERAIDMMGPNHNKKTDKFTVSPEQSGKWIFKTLTDKNATTVAIDSDTSILTYRDDNYYCFKCEFNVKVSSLQKPGDQTLMFILIGVGVLALIIVIQTGVICYILKAKKIRRIEQMALSNRPRGNDTARYSTTPSRKHSLKTGSTEEIYETLDIIQTAAEAPPPPPIETLPRPAKTASTDKTPLLPGYPNQPSMHPRTPVPSEEERIRHRPAMPLPNENEAVNLVQNPVNKNETEPLTRTESNFSVHLRPKGKVKIPAFCAPPATAAPLEKVKPIRNPSTITQDAISNELNDILKKRRAGTMGGPKPQKMVAIPEPVKETKPKLPAPLAKGLKPPHKPTMSVTPVKQQPTAPRPPLPTQKNPPPIASKTPNWFKHPKKQPTLPPLPTQPKPRPTPIPAHPISQHPLQSPPLSPGFQKQMPAPPTADPVLPDYTEMPEYAEYNEQEDDSADEWTYEPLDPPSKYDYNIYST